jgi:D-sedoheptulose 7-phosphate isomerase
MTATHEHYVSDYLARSAVAMTEFAADQQAQEVLANMAQATCQAMRDGNKLLIAGNGGSAADSQHIAGEFISRLMFDHAPLPAIALTVDTSALTATANDYGYEFVFERQVEALARRGDIFLGISTSGRSPNVLRAFTAARQAGALCFGFAGRDPRDMAGCCDMIFRAHSDFTPIIQQIHITAAHVFCALVERGMFPERVTAARA